MRKSEELTNPNSCMSRARDDEMTFVLLGRDEASPGTVSDWIRRRIGLGKNAPTDAQIVSAKEWIETVVCEHGWAMPSEGPALMGEQVWTVLLFAERVGLLLGCLRNYQALGRQECDLQGALNLEPEVARMLADIRQLLPKAE